MNATRNITSSHILAGADLGADHTLGGGDDTFASGSIGTVKIGGTVSGASVIGAGLSSTNAIFKDGDESAAPDVTVQLIGFKTEVDETLLANPKDFRRVSIAEMRKVLIVPLHVVHVSRLFRDYSRRLFQ